MNPLAALGLASNVVQFVDFTSGLMRTAKEIYRSADGATSAVLDLDTLYSELRDHLDQLVLGHNKAGRYLHLMSTRSNSSDHTLRNMSTLCKSDCEKLLTKIKELKDSGGSRGRWRSFRIALKYVWNEEEIQDLEHRLIRTQVSQCKQLTHRSNHAQDLRSREHERLQQEILSLQLDQSAKLASFMAETKEFKESVGKFRRDHNGQLPSEEAIARLEHEIEKLYRSQASIQQEQVILKSLRFDTQPIRHENIPAAYKKTFEWVYKPQEGDGSTVGNIPRWLESDERLFWVSGKPGSGKSTFMKFVAGEPRTRGLLAGWAKEEPFIIASHYFWSAGNGMQKSEEGLLRTLLYDIFRQCSELIVPVCGSRVSSRKKRENHEKEGGNLPWTLPDLRAALQKIATLEVGSPRICLFIDGLDEYEGDPQTICQVLRDLLEPSRIRMCVSSRPWNVFEEAFGEQENKLYIQDLTRNDILEYTRDNLYGHKRWKFLSTAALQGEQLIEEIEHRACGVFLWVYPVVKKLRTGLTNRDSFSDLRRRLECVPDELEDFFRHILQSVENFYHEKMSTTLQIAVAAGETLHAMAYDRNDYVFELPVRCLTALEEEQLEDETVWRLNSRTHGLLEMNRTSGTVTFLHRTVMDFLRTPPMTRFLIERAPVGFDVSLCLLKVYVSTIKMKAFGHVNRQEFGTYGASELQSLIKKALASAEEGQATHDPDNSPTAFFREQIVSGMYAEFLSWKIEADSEYLSGLDPSLILRARAPRGDYQETMLDKQWRSGGLRMLQAMLDKQRLDPKQSRWNSNPRKRWTAWTAIVHHATSWTRFENQQRRSHFWDLMRHDIFCLLLQRGADPNAVIWVGMTEGWVAFAAFLNLAFEIAPDAENESLYMRTLKIFLRIHGVLEDSGVTHLNGLVQKEMGEKVKSKKLSTAALLTAVVYLTWSHNQYMKPQSFGRHAWSSGNGGGQDEGDEGDEGLHDERFGKLAKINNISQDHARNCVHTMRAIEATYLGLERLRQHDPDQCGDGRPLQAKTGPATHKRRSPTQHNSLSQN
ncbi:hypothetical protein CSOJ01_06926 [Colletotrichum sojae]|uniref:NACHT domain-containing protein n=1 Tax=Colletotrichum sojae TaxID=2175907 RepID=A0A8H6MV44_9PEZI|nr:hypothetical protein CSOJ01_06926 [Colletotrichum sojae]